MSDTSLILGVPSPVLNNLVYVVDDEREIGQLISLMVESAGYQYKVFTCPQAAFESFLKEPSRPSLLITDYEMGAWNGFDLIEHCLMDHPHLKVMMVSGSITQRDIKASGIRIDRFLAKPFMMNDLLATIQDLLPSRFFVPPPGTASQRVSEKWGSARELRE